MDYIINSWQDILVVLGTSMIPVIELRGAIPVAHGVYNMPWLLTYILCTLGNCLPVPFIIAYMKPIFRFIRHKIKIFAKVVDWLETRTLKKAEKVNKYSGLALYLFVAIPLPGTGAWTGAMIAAMLDMRLKKSIPWIVLGVFTAGLIVTLLTYHII